jgi:hypothetical protein
MSIIHYLLEHVNIYILGFLIVAIYVLASIAGLFIMRKFLPHQKCKNHNDVAGFIFATMGVIYAVLIAFMVIVTWENFDKASDLTSKEANSLASLYRDSTPFPEEVRNQIKNELKEYVTAIIEDEWPQMARNKSAKAQEAQEHLWQTYSKFNPKNDTQKIFLGESVSKLNEAGEFRRQRILNAREVIHPILYFVLIVGGFLTIAFTLFFGTENFVPQIIMTSLLATMIALTLFTIIALDCPFTGDISIKPDVFRTVLSSLMSS